VFEPPAFLAAVRTVPAGLRGGQEGHRGRGGDHEVDGGGGAVKFVGVELTFVVGSVVIFLVALGVGLFLAVSP
jgi:hypothetical protein